jgi:hypothetical protein
LSFKASFPKLSIAIVLCPSFKYLSRTIVARRFLGVPCFVGGSAFLACSSLALYYSKAPIHSIILRIVASLEQAWPTSSILIYIEANQVVRLLIIHIEPSHSTIVVVVGAPLRLGCNVLRILKWTSISTS